MSIINLRKLAVAVLLGSALAACNGNHNGEQEAAAPAGGVTPSAPQATSLAIASLSIGNYVQDGTFTVGGVASQFSTADSLFANVKWTGDASSSKLVIKLLDSSGGVVMEKPAATLQPTQTSTNFTLRSASDGRLAVGSYRVEVFANGELKMGADIKIAD